MRSQSQKLSQSRVHHLLQVREKHQESRNCPPPAPNSSNRYLHSCNWHNPECQISWCPSSRWLSTSRRAFRFPLARALEFQSINGNPLPLYCFLTMLEVVGVLSRSLPCRGTPRESSDQTCGPRCLLWLCPQHAVSGGSALGWRHSQARGFRGGRTTR